jgi:hypothetical protein
MKTLTITFYDFLNILLNKTANKYGYDILIHMDFLTNLEPIKEAVLSFLSNPILADIGLGIFVLFLGFQGMKRGYRFAFFHLIFSVLILGLALSFVLDIVAPIVSGVLGVNVQLEAIDLTRTIGMFAILTGTLLFGWLISGLIYILFLPIKKSPLKQKYMDPMVYVKINVMGFSLGLLEAVMYVLLYNVVMLNISAYMPDLFSSRFISTPLRTLNPNNSMVLSLINQTLGNYGVVFRLNG